MHLAISFLGLQLTNPLVLPSGFLGVTGASLADAARRGAGAVTTKTIWLQPHAGHPNPTVIDLGGGNLINAVGLPHGGIAEAAREIADARRLTTAPLIASVTASTTEQFAEITERVAALAPDLIELNISCPNVEDEFGRPFACEPQMAERATRAARRMAGSIPLSVKLSPNVAAIGEIARAVEAAGADAITAINTVGPGMVIDIETRTPILANKVGGLSGPAIRPVAVRCVYDIYRAVRIPIIGMGGVVSAHDVVEMLLAGATLVGVGSTIALHSVDVFAKINNELTEWCDAHGVEHLAELVGAAHRN